jgi:hypothetical protein
MMDNDKLDLEQYLHRMTGFLLAGVSRTDTTSHGYCDSSGHAQQDQEMIIGKLVHGSIKALTVGLHHTKRHGLYCNLFFNSSKLYFKKWMNGQPTIHPKE